MGTALSKLLIGAATQYRECLDLYGDSRLVLRLFAGFLRDMTNDSEYASELYNKSLRQVNASGSNEQNLSKKYFSSVFDEKNAVIIVSGRSDTLGNIVDCNATALNIFGFKNKVQLGGCDAGDVFFPPSKQDEAIRRNIDAIIPAPLNAVHTQVMRKNLQLGHRGFSNQTHLVFARHSNGYSR
jgi:PAS domain-containing protein